LGLVPAQRLQTNAAWIPACAKERGRKGGFETRPYTQSSIVSCASAKAQANGAPEPASRPWGQRAGCISRLQDVVSRRAGAFRRKVLAPLDWPLSNAFIRLIGGALCIMSRLTARQGALCAWRVTRSPSFTNRLAQPFSS